MDDDAEGQRVSTRTNSIFLLIQGAITFVSWSLFLHHLEINPGVRGAEWTAVVLQSLSALLVSFTTSVRLWLLGAVTAIGILTACWAVLRVSPLSDTIALIGLSSTAAILLHAAFKVCAEFRRLWCWGGWVGG